MKKKVGLIVNPVAGVGGAVGLKGSDGIEIQRLALEKGAQKLACQKAALALEELVPFAEEIIVFAAPGAMGEDIARKMGFSTVTVGETAKETTAEDTERIARQLRKIPVDVLLFAGGDGTARNIYAALGEGLAVVGVPAGVKIHSAVYATSPAAAGKALHACLTGSIRLRDAEVMDIDEAMYRAGRLQTKLYGYLSVPVLRGVMQNPKAASHNSDNDVGGICAEIEDRVDEVTRRNPDARFIFGAGSTVGAVMRHLGFSGTLLGVDVACKKELIARDAAEAELLALTKDAECHLIITAIGGQGHIFGRGNQQLSPQVIRQIGLSNIWVVAAASKIYSLPDQTLYVDAGDPHLNKELRGYRKVIVGWQEMLMCNVL